MLSADLISSIIEQIVRDFHPLQIVLFGSHARGDAGPESDVDLLRRRSRVGETWSAVCCARRYAREKCSMSESERLGEMLRSRTERLVLEPLKY